METFCVHSLIDTTFEESVEFDPVDYGDIREKWDCEYVVDFYAPGYVCCGSDSTKQLHLYQFKPGNADFGSLAKRAQCILLSGAHGDEIVRDVNIHNSVIYTGGEDGLVKMWNVACDNLENISSRLFFYVIKCIYIVIRVATIIFTGAVLMSISIGDYTTEILLNLQIYYFAPKETF